MTTVAPGRPDTAPDGSDGEGDDGDGDGGRRWNWRAAAYGGLLVSLMLAIPVLGYSGYRILLDEDTGTLEDVETDPDAPGFEAVVTPTPTLLALDTDVTGQLAGVTLFSLTAEPEAGGAVVTIPVTTNIELPLTDPPVKPLHEIYELGGAETLDKRIETMLGAATGELVEIPPEQWAALVEPVAPLTVDNPVETTVLNPDGSPGPTFPAGEIQLEADQVAAFVQGREADETDLQRTDRRNAFFAAWLDAVAASDEPDVVPGETEAGLGRFVRRLADGEHVVETAPVEQVPIPGLPVSVSDVFVPDEEAMAQMVADDIPFPTGVGRMRTRLVDGVGEGSALRLQAARDLVAAGAQVTVIANAEEFGQERTVVVYFRRRDKEKAEALAEALGTDRVERQEAQSQNVDAVVVIGRDYVERAGSAEDADGGATPSTVPVAEPEGQIQPGAPGGDPLG